MPAIGTSVRLDGVINIREERTQLLPVDSIGTFELVVKLHDVIEGLDKEGELFEIFLES